MMAIDVLRRAGGVRWRNLSAPALVPPPRQRAAAMIGG